MPADLAFARVTLGAAAIRRRSDCRRPGISDSLGHLVFLLFRSNLALRRERWKDEFQW